MYFGPTMLKSASTKSGVLHRILLAFLGLTSGALLVEIGAHIALGSPQAGINSRDSFAFYIYDHTLGWRGNPQVEGLHTGPGFQVPVRLNSRGFRDTEIPYDKSPGVYRILVLGDSFVWGWGVRDSQRLTAVLAERLVDRRRRVEVINLGMAGYGTDQEYLLLQQEGLKYHPDLVVLAYTTDNDVYDNLFRVAYRYQKPHFEVHNGSTLALTNVPVPPGEGLWKLRQTDFLGLANEWLVQRSWIYRATADQLKRGLVSVASLSRASSTRNDADPKTGNSTPQKPYYYYWELSQAQREAGLRVTSLLVRQMKQEVEATKSRFLLVVIPSAYQRDEPDRKGRLYNDQVSELLRLLPDVPTLDLTTSIGAAPPQVELYSVAVDNHWTIEGHRLAGDILADYVARMFLQD